MNDESRRYQAEQDAFMQKAHGYLQKVQNGRSVLAKDPRDPAYSQAADDERLARQRGLGAFIQHEPPVPVQERMTAPSQMKDRRYTTAELDAMEQEAVSQGMAPAAATDAVNILSGEIEEGENFTGGFGASLQRTVLGLKQAYQYMAGDDAGREAVNAAIRKLEEHPALQTPSGQLGDAVGTASQFMGPQGVTSAASKAIPLAITKGARLLTREPGSIGRAALQGGAFEAAQPVVPSDASTGEYLLDKTSQVAKGLGIGAGSGVVGKYALREGVATPPDRQAMMQQAARLGLSQYITPAQRTGSELLEKLELGFRSKAGSEGLFAAKDRGMQAGLERKSAQAIGSSADAPTERVLRERWQAAMKGYEPISQIKKMSIDAQYFDALHALARDTVAKVANPTAVAMAKRLLSTAHKMTGDDLLGQTQKMRNAGFKALATDPPKAEVYNDLAKIMEDYTERRVTALVAQGKLPKDAMAKFTQSRTELAKIRAIEEAVDPVTGTMSASKYLKGVYERTPAHGGAGVSPTSQGLQDVTETAKVMQHIRPQLSNMGNLMTGRELQSAATGLFSTAIHSIPLAKNYLAGSLYLKYGGKPGFLANYMTPTQNAFVRRMLPGVTFAAEEGLTE